MQMKANCVYDSYFYLCELWKHKEIAVLNIIFLNTQRPII